MSSKRLYCPATLIGLLVLALISPGCKSRRPDTYVPAVVSVPMLNGNHIRSWSKEEALRVPELAEQARIAQKSVYVGSDTGFLLMWGLDMKPEE